MKKFFIFPALALCMVLAACAGTVLSSWQNDLDAADAGVAALEAAYVSVCAADSSSSICTPTALAQAQNLEKGINSAINLAQSAINIYEGASAGSPPTQAQLQAAIQAVIDSVNAFSNFVSTLQTKASAQGLHPVGLRHAG